MRMLKAERKALENRIKELEDREQILRARERSAKLIESEDSTVIRGADAAEVNYILGQSKGYVDGFQSAVNTVISMLAEEYRDIPIGEAELFMIYELGTIKERAWLKDHKQGSIMENNGWKMDWKGFAPVWRKEEKNDEVSGDSEET